MLRELKTEEFDCVYKLMQDSFPINEYRPYEEQKALLDNPLYSLYGLIEGEPQKIKGFIAVWQFQCLAFIEHFAVNPIYRNSGIGGSILQKITGALHGLICLEVELPDSELTRRRIEFYQRNGFIFNDYPYMQPAISKGRDPIPLRIMTWGQTLTEEKFREITEILYKNVYHIG